MLQKNSYLFVFIAFLAGCASQTKVGSGDAAATVSSTRTVDVVDHDFGLKMADPYRWMEGEGNAEFDAWLDAQGEIARAQLDAIPGVTAWRHRLTAAASASTLHGSHVQVGKRLFFRRSAKGAEPSLMIREADEQERVLFDPSTLEGVAQFNGFAVSPDGRYVAVNIGLGGNEIGEIALLDVASGERMPDTIAPIWGEFQASWLPDSSGFFYTRMRTVDPADPDPLQGMSTWLHQLGQPLSRDRMIVSAGGQDALGIPAKDFPIVLAEQGSDWLVLLIGGARSSSRMCVAPRSGVDADRIAWRCLVEIEDNVQDFALMGDQLFLLSARDAPNRNVLRIDLRDPDASPATARVVVPERRDRVVTAIAAAADGMYIKTMQRGLDQVERMDYRNGERKLIALPESGAIHLLRTSPQRAGALISLEGWIAPRTVYSFDGTAFSDTGLGDQDAPAYPELMVEQIEAISADGTVVPLSIVRRRDLVLDGSALALVEGYGGYGISIQPFFMPLLLEWPQNGNVSAVCHVRGGGENGDGWRLAGSGSNKQRGVEDFIACAKALHARGYSSPQRTAGMGASMGGVLTGGAYVTAPDVWGAMVITAGLLNPVRLLAAKNGANQIDEMGDPGTEAGMRQLLAMDPYQNLRAGQIYPPLLLITGLNDQRVAPWHSGKFGARVLSLAPRTPVWFRTDSDTGHFTTSGNAMAQEFADVYGFLETMLTR